MLIRFFYELILQGFQEFSLTFLLKRIFWSFKATSKEASSFPNSKS